MNSEMDLFAERVTALVELAGGNSEFARKCDVSEGVVRKWKNGESDPSRTRLITIANAMNVSLIWLATGEGLMLIPDGITQEPNSDALAITSSADEYCYIALYDVYASAGHGSLIDQEQVIDRLAFKRDWVKGEMGLSPENCCLISVTGDSMETTLHNKDVVMLDISHTIYMSDGIYCLRLDGGLLVKRLQRINGQQFKVISDNPVYEPFILNNEDVELIGKAVWAGKRL